MKTAEKFLEEKGLKDSLYDVHNEIPNQWIKGGLSKLLNDYASSRSMESQWISVEERLPSEDEIILCLTNSGQSVCEYVNYNDNKSRFYLNDLDYYCELENVTHWMPLPENPPTN